MVNIENDISPNLSFASVRISRLATLLLNETIENVFPLFGPLREMEWAEGWNPEMLYGNNDVQERMVFRTPPGFEGESPYLWIISKYDADEHTIEYTVRSDDRVWFINVETRPFKLITMATVTYTYIGLTRLAHERNLIALERMFERNLTDWEDAINHYIRTGKKLIN